MDCEDGSERVLGCAEVVVKNRSEGRAKELLSLMNAGWRNKSQICSHVT